MTRIEMEDGSEAWLSLAASGKYVLGVRGEGGAASVKLSPDDLARFVGQAVKDIATRRAKSKGAKA